MAKETNIIKQFNNGTLIATMPKSKVKDMGFTDSALLRNTFKEHRAHLGTLQLFQEMDIVTVPLMKELTEKKNYMYVNGIDGAFTWDVLLDATFPEVVEDVEEGEYLGIDLDEFKIKLSYPFRQNDILTYDPIDGVQVLVVGNVEDTGNGFVHTVKLVTNNREAYFPKNKLVAGTRFGKIDNVVGEYDNKFSGVDNAISNSKATLEFRLGGVRGVEVAWTTWAKSVSLNTGDHAKAHSETLNALQNQMNAWGAKGDDMLVYGMKTPQGKLAIKRIDGVLETLAMAEFYKMTATGIMFNQGMTVTGGMSSKKINEGILPMARRGHRFTYNNASELKSMIKKAADTIFRNSIIPTEKRRLMFKGGFEVTKLLKDLFKQEFISTYPMALEPLSLPAPLLVGGLDGITYKTFTITESFINGIGNVAIEHDPSFDYDFGDFVSRGFEGIGGRSKRTWSLVIWDAADSKYSNVHDKSVLPNGVAFDDKAKGGNLWLVKPEGLPDVNTSRKIGRTEGTNVAAVMDTMGEEFAVWGSMSAWIKDLTSLVIIEKANSIDYVQ